MAQFIYESAIAEEDGRIYELLMLLLLHFSNFVDFIFGHTKKNFHILELVLIKQLRELFFRCRCLFILQLKIDIIFIFLIISISLLVVIVWSPSFYLFQIISAEIIFALNNFSLRFIFFLLDQRIFFFVFNISLAEKHTFFSCFLLWYHGLI